MICPNMKKTTLKSIMNALSNMEKIIKVPAEIRIPAKMALDRMLDLK
jgi:quinolinate synthase